MHVKDNKNSPHGKFHQKSVKQNRKLLQIAYTTLFMLLSSQQASEKATRGVSPFLAWGDFHERSRFARPTIPEEKWGTTRSLSGDEPANIPEDRDSDKEEKERQERSLSESGETTLMGTKL